MLSMGAAIAFAFGMANKVIGIAAAIMIHRYRVFRYEGPSNLEEHAWMGQNQNGLWNVQELLLSCANTGQPIPSALCQGSISFQNIMADDPPEVFISSCILYAYCFMSTREKLKYDKYRDTAVVMGLCGGVAATIYTGNVNILKGYLAWSAMMALELSALGHWAWRTVYGRNPGFRTVQDSSLDQETGGKHTFGEEK